MLFVLVNTRDPNPSFTPKEVRTLRSFAASLKNWYKFITKLNIVKLYSINQSIKFINILILQFGQFMSYLLFFATYRKCVLVMLILDFLIGLHRILIWPDIRQIFCRISVFQPDIQLSGQPDIRRIKSDIRPDIKKQAGYPVQTYFLT